MQQENILSKEDFTVKIAKDIFSDEFVGFTKSDIKALIRRIDEGKPLGSESVDMDFKVVVPKYTGELLSAIALLYNVYTANQSVPVTVEVVSPTCDYVEKIIASEDIDDEIKQEFLTYKDPINRICNSANEPDVRIVSDKK